MNQTLAHELLDDWDLIFHDNFHSSAARPLFSADGFFCSEKHTTTRSSKFPK